MCTRGRLWASVYGEDNQKQDYVPDDQGKWEVTVHDLMAAADLCLDLLVLFAGAIGASLVRLLIPRGLTGVAMKLPRRATASH